MADKPDKRPKQPTDEVMKARALSRWEGEGGAPIEGRRPKRSRAPAQLAKTIVDVATGKVEDREPKEGARRGGLRGAKREQKR